jgi:hypothetical protein
MSKEMREQMDKMKNFLKENSEEKLNISDVISSKLKKAKCSLLGHKFIYDGRSNGNIWGWNNYVCERCGAKIDSLTD